MATGPEHYRDAETFIDDANESYIEDDMATVAIKLQFAQVHATLALTAATARGVIENAAWAEVLAP